MVKQLKLKETDSAKLDKNLAKLDTDQLKSDYVVDFHVSELKIEEDRVVDCYFDGSVVKWDNYSYKRHKANDTHFKSYVCMRNKSAKCTTLIYVPKNAETGKIKAILGGVDHKCMPNFKYYDDNGRSINLNKLFDSISTLIAAGIDSDILFGENEFDWPDNMSDELQKAADYFTECYYLNEKFENKFADEKGNRYSVYARFKGDVEKNRQVERRFANFGYVGQRSGTAGDRVANERRERTKEDWLKKIKFFVQSRPIRNSHLLIPSIDLHTCLCEKQSKIEEALIQRLFVKLPNKPKLVFNSMYDNFDQKYRLGNWKQDLKNAAFILCRGLFTAKIRLDDYRPADEGELRARLTELNKIDESVFVESTSLFKPTLKLNFKNSMCELETHTNGFRYTTLRGDKIDVLYNNINHAFFQPCDDEMPILLHFSLKNPVLVNDEELLDIWIGAKVCELLGENNEKLVSQELNSMFQSFCDKVEYFTKGKMRFEKLRTEFGFTGVFSDLAVTLKSTPTCLVSLTEMPILVIRLDEIELVHFERVSANTRSFDMIIVFKDYEKKTQQIDYIPAQSLDSVKDWLNSCDILYSEGSMSLDWDNIMKTIEQNPEAFFSNGGWDRLKSDEFDVESGEPVTKKSKNE